MYIENFNWECFVEYYWICGLFIENVFYFEMIFLLRFYLVGFFWIKERIYDLFFEFKIFFVVSCVFIRI